MIRIDNNLMDNLILKAKKSERERLTHNFHESNDEVIQRFINAVGPKSYVRPHKHLDSPEVFIILKGEMWIVEFDDNGKIKDKCLIKPSGVRGVEVKANSWHSMISLKPDSVVYIVLKGPYDPEKHKIFPDWAPINEEEGIRYTESILKRVK